MTKTTRITTRLGELVAAAFDEAARYSADPAEISRTAIRIVRDLAWYLRFATDNLNEYVPVRSRAYRTPRLNHQWNPKE